MDNQTIKTYNKLAKEYDDETLHFWEQFPRSFLDKFIELSGKKIIDVGSGPGRDGLLLKQAGKEVVCVDASSEMIKLSKQKGLDSVIADFNELPFADLSADGVWSYTSLLHIPKKNIEQPISEIFRILKPDGLFALGLIEGDVEEYRRTAGEDLPRWFSFYQKDEVVDLCKIHGFELIYFEKFKPRSKNYLNFIFKKV